MRVVLESTLPPPHHISQVAPRSGKDDALFAELAAVLRKHDALDRFGITLLHRHFDIVSGEVLLEETDVQARTQRIQPIAADALSGEGFTETAWRLGDGFVAMACFCRDSGAGHQHLTSR